MKIQRDKLHQYQRRITVLTDKETEIAKQMIAKGDKKRALLALRRKKYQETLLAQTDAQLEQLEKLTSNVEFAKIQKDVVFGLQQGTKVLKEIHAEMGGIDHVEKLMGDNAEAIAYQKVCFAIAQAVNRFQSINLTLPLQEISDMLGGRISNQDEEEVEDELAALEAEMSGTKENTQQELPNVPNSQLPQRTENEPEREHEPQPMLAQ